jgi:UrcA family protein
MNMSCRSNVLSPVLATIAVACLSLTSMGAYASDGGSGPESTKKIVSYGDLNLANSHAVELLYRRIAAAAKAVCGDPNARNLQAQARNRACVEQSIERAVDAVDRPTLTAFYGTKTGRSTNNKIELSRR